MAAPRSQQPTVKLPDAPAVKEYRVAAHHRSPHDPAQTPANVGAQLVSIQQILALQLIFLADIDQR
jgi:hypothetical protein